MAEIKFGKNQFGKPTPAKIANLFDLLAAIFGIVSGWLVAASYVPHAISDILSSIFTALCIPVCLLLKKFFGSQVTDDSVPLENVSQIKENKDEPK